MSRIATVFGATGLQGGSVVRALLKQGTFKPRAVTRNVASDAAKELQTLGAEVVEGDLADLASIKKAVAGAEVVFAVTMPSFVPGKGNPEIEQGKFMVDAAKEAGVRYLVWSSIASVSSISGGKYKNVSLDDKAAVDGYLGASGLPHSILLTGGFLENWTRKQFPDSATLTEAGEVTFKSRWVPGTLAPLSWIGRDLGNSVAALANAYAAGRLDEINGKSYLMMNANIPIEEYHKKIEHTLGKKVNVTWLETVNFPAIDDMYDCAKEFPWYGGKQVPDPGLVALGVQFGTIEEFIRTDLKAHLGL